MEYGNSIEYTTQYPSGHMLEVLRIDAAKHGFSSYEIRSNDRHVGWFVNPQSHRIEEFPDLIERR